MEVFWIRGNEKISFTRPHIWFVLGVRGAGKSSLLEHIGVQYLKKGACVLDLFGSRDGEGLAWLRSPYAKSKRVLLLHGGSVRVHSSVDAKPASEFSLKDLDRYDIVVSASPLYSDSKEEYDGVNKIVDMLYKRFTWNRLVYVIVREAANLYYSRLRAVENQAIAKAQFIYLLREARHMGLALGLDTLKFTSIDVDVRTLADYVLIKQLGVLGLPHDLSWLYSFFDPLKLQNLPPQYFIVLTRKGSIGVGEFPYHSWHKREKENILSKVNITIERYSS